MITGLTSLLAAQESAVTSQVAAAVASKQIDAIQHQGAAANELLQAAAKMSKSIDTGGNFDAVA